ncbi:MAG: methionyl-tRNA formyltransferase [Oscillospiraceae bacterium]|nr:methionyl-tRNA formyltransferase [Oscillospiraceae bacterium]
MRIVFMGTPDFAVPSLRALVEAGHTVCGAFTQPDRPKNRGMKLQATPVKEFCLAQQIPVFQPAGFRDGEAMAQLQNLRPELIVVAAYGRILPQAVLDLPSAGCINVHSSLLPKYRGAAPINWAILNGERETGVTIMHMSAQLDAGDIIAQRATAIEPEETAEQLTARLAQIGAQLLRDTVAQIEEGRAGRTSQQEEHVSYAPMLSKQLSAVDWSRPAQAIHDQVRGLLPWPAAAAPIGGVRCKILNTKVRPETSERPCATVLRADKKGLYIVCGGGSVLELLQVQPDGKKAMAASAFLLGHPLKEGSVLQ